VLFKHNFSKREYLISRRWRIGCPERSERELLCEACLKGTVSSMVKIKLPMLYLDPMTTLDQLNARGWGYLPGLIGIETEGVSRLPYVLVV